MKTPIRHRNGIPFFYDKTALDFKKDAYEKYDEMVVRQTALHLADELWGHYPMQPVLDFAEEHYQNYWEHNVLEVGCGVGRWIGGLAKRFTGSKCQGIDYSYQMLKRAHEFWINGKELIIDLSNKGFSDRLKVQGHQLDNLQLGLAKASDLPFAKESQDLVLSSFLLDRLENPAKSLLEMHRVLKPNGQLILITPLNFKQAVHWEAYYPPARLAELLTEIGFGIIDWQEEIIIREPLDFRGNMVTWKCLGVVARKAK